MSFLGEHKHTIDAKGRVFLPAKFREDEDQQYVICRSFYNHEKCVCVYTEMEFENYKDKVVEDSKKSRRIVERAMGAIASYVTPDSQGRLLLTQKLRSYAELEKDVTIIGAGDHIEIWDTANLDAVLDADMELIMINDKDK